MRSALNSFENLVPQFLSRAQHVYLREYEAIGEINRYGEFEILVDHAFEI
jgi:hypothetical protein